MPVTVKLTKPLLDGKVEAFTFREPRFQDVMLLGEPTAPLSLGGDRYIPTPLPSVIGSYAERLLIDGNPGVLAHACLRDTLAIQKVIIGFFEEAGRETKSEGLDASSPSSPSRDSPTSTL